ncbi:hypothetical protein [Prosthecobacter sp.]|uniref:hypothetical protein n=1 Tax=Prosthecobacter sp. TaxID=1965333 RepID=UPI0025E31F49|nr:hypothetical protein [Prosthecobacter sp.]
MKHPQPLEAFFAFCLVGTVLAGMAGLALLAALLGMTAAGSLACRRVRQNAGFPRPVVTYLEKPSPDEPLIRLERGQTAIVPWPQPLQVLLPEGTHLQILEANPERVRVMAV